MTRMLQAALYYAEHLGPVLPLFTVVNGVCDCPDTYKQPDKKGKVRCKPGKHPRISNGSDGASRDREQVERWWAMWPNANIGLALKPAGLVDVAPDSEHWLETFKGRGLPRTLSYQSGSGAGHAHYLYVKPADWPTFRSCKPEQYDILSDGYAVLPPSTNGVGPYRWLTKPTEIDELPTAPLWVKDHAVPKTALRGNLPPGDEDEPPVRMSERALQRWRGEAEAFNVADRSSKLYAIANDLARANASLRTIVGALADRDQALGLNKFCERDDADERYAEIASRAIANLDAGDAEGQLAPQSDDDGSAAPPTLCQDNCEAQLMVDLIRDILANQNHSRASAKLALVALFLRYGWALRRAPQVEHRVSLTLLGEDVGLTNNTVSNGIRLYDGKPGSPLQWRKAEADKGSYAPPTFVSLRVDNFREFGPMARAFNPNTRQWGGDRQDEPAPSCEHGSPAVAEVTERFVRTHLVSHDGCEYLHSPLQPGATTTRQIQVAECGESDAAAGRDRNNLESCTTYSEGQLAPRLLSAVRPDAEQQAIHERFVALYERAGVT